MPELSVVHQTPQFWAILPEELSQPQHSLQDQSAQITAQYIDEFPSVLLLDRLGVTVSHS